MSIEDLLKKHADFDVAMGSGFIFLMPIEDDPFDHTMYKIDLSDPNKSAVEYNYISFIADGYAKDDNVRPVTWDEMLKVLSVTTT